MRKGRATHIVYVQRAGLATNSILLLGLPALILLSESLAETWQKIGGGEIGGNIFV